ncbi:MAG: phosphatase PAP2 family protein [Haloferacaceae archaeon]
MTTPVPPAPLSSRGLGVTEVLAGAPDPVVAAFAALTLLGNPLVLFALVAVVYWRPPSVAAEPRRAVASLVALSLGGAALVFALKGLFALPRPPGVAESGYGFPSGHALGSTVVYGGAALLFDGLDRRRTVPAAAAVVCLVAASRLVLGVHYLVDVAAGVAVGVAFLGVAVGLGLDRPGRGFVAAVALAAAAVAVTAREPDPAAVETARDAAAVGGGAVGGALAWRVVEGDEGPVSLPTAVAGFVVATGLWGGSVAMDLPLPAVVAAGGVAVALAMGLPRLAVAVAERKEAGTVDR